MDKFIQDDRDRIDRFVNTAPVTGTYEIREESIKEELWKCQNSKADIDEISPIIVKKAWPIIKDHLVTCLTVRSEKFYFPLAGS